MQNNLVDQDNDFNFNLTARQKWLLDNYAQQVLDSLILHPQVDLLFKFVDYILYGCINKNKYDTNKLTNASVHAITNKSSIISIVGNYKKSKNTEFSKTDQISLNIHHILDVFCLADPSQNNSAVQWLMQVAKNNCLNITDIIGAEQSVVYRALDYFSRIKNKLPLEQRSLYYYESFDQFVNIIKYYNFDPHCEKVLNSIEDLNSERAKKRIFKQTIKQQTHVLFQTDQVKVIVPLTKEAAQWWGMNTKWCTSAENNNMFDHYNQDAPLFVIMFKQKGNTQKFRKIQLYIDENGVQFTDEKNEFVNKRLIVKNWEVLSIFFIKLAQNYPEIIQYIPDRVINNEFAWKLIDNLIAKSLAKNKLVENELVENKLVENKLVENTNNENKQNDRLTKLSADFYFDFDLIPTRARDLPMITWAFENNLISFTDIPTKMRSQKISEQAIEKNCLFIQYTNHRFLTNSFLSQKIVESNGICFSYIPRKLLTPALCLQAVQVNSYCLRWIPEGFKTQQICEIAFKESRLNIQWIPEQFVTVKMCKQAVGKNGNLLKWLPEKFQTLEICKQAVKQTGDALGYVPKALCTPEICLLACEQTGFALKWVPKKFQTVELYKISVQHTGMALGSVPYRFRTLELCKIALTNDYETFNLIPRKLLTQQMCDQVVYKDCSLFTQIPKKFKNEKLYLYVMQKDKYAFYSFPNSAKTQPVCLAAIEQSECYFEYFPKTSVNQQIATTAARKDFELVKKIPKEFYSKEICLIAALNFEDALSVIPEKFQDKEVLDVFNQATVKRIRKQKRDNKRREMIAKSKTTQKPNWDMVNFDQLFN